MTINCDRCGAECVPNGMTTGYGTDTNGKRHCFACCGELDKQAMIETGRTILYLAGNKATNWPGTLSFPVVITGQSRHGGGFNSPRVDFRFKGPDGAIWSGVNRGDQQAASVRRTKLKSLSA